MLAYFLGDMIGLGMNSFRVNMCVAARLNTISWPCCLQVASFEVVRSLAEINALFRGAHC